VDFPIAANDDAIRSVRMILAAVGQVITQACAEFEAKHARRAAPEETAPVGAPAVGVPVETAPVVAEAVPPVA